MNYSKIRVLVNNKRLKQKELAEILGVTPHGVTYKFEKESMTVSDLEKLAEYFSVPISYFFDLEPGLPTTNEKGGCIDCYKKEAIIETLKSQLKEKESRIDELNRELGRRSTEKRAKAG